MSAINVNVITEVNIDMSLNKAEAEELLHHLQTACCAPRVPSLSPATTRPYTDIVKRLALAIQAKGV